MESFRTTFEPLEGKVKIKENNDLVFMGSCFTENIGKKLVDYKFSTLINPFGILYNPESIIQCLHMLLSNYVFSEQDLIEQNGVWNSFYHHSKFSGTSKSEVLETINQQSKIGRNALKRSNYLFITFGTAWVYQLIDSGNIVSNCHKLPEKNFKRFRLSVNEIVEKYKVLINELKEHNKDIQIIFTVSPVRHMKDGAIENQLSKSTLILAANQLAEQFTQVSYFPAYEIMMDDLRDYRFYNNDMVHPSNLAVNYIWEAFKKSWVAKSAFEFMKDVEKIKSAIQHRPFQPEAASHQIFIKKQIELIRKLSKKYPKANFNKELAYFESILI